REFSALVIGDGPDRDALVRTAGEAGLEACVTWAGQLADVPARLLESRVFLLTSRWEGVSIAMLEAMACGCVPVVSDVGDLRDVVADGENGYVLSGDDIDGYVARLEALLSDRSHWERLSSNARATARRTAGKDVVAARWSETIGRARDEFFTPR